MKEIPSAKDFNLSKVKLLPGGGLKVNYQIVVVNDGESCLVDRVETSDRDIHPDLLNLFKDLRIVVGRCLGITSFLSLLESDEMKIPASKMEKAREFADGLMEKFDVRGVAWSGTNESVGVVITSVFETANGLKTCINTPRIKLSQISFGFEEELEKIVDSVKTEVYEFLFNGKSAQLSLFEGPDDMPDED